MNPKDLKQRALNFFGTSPGIGFGSFGVPSFTRGVRITPRRNVPQSVVEKISKSYGASSEDSLASSASAVNNLGRVALSLEQTKNNLDRIVEVIAEDYKISKDQNKKEADEYRKRIANRGRFFGKKELGDKKTDLGFSIGKYVSSFFSKDGILGGLAALSTLKLIEALLSGDLSKVIGPLMALASVVIVPKIIGLILKQIGKNVLGNLFKGGTATAGAGAAAGAGRFAGLAKFGGKAALLGGGLALGSQLFKSNESNSQQRLEELTQEQKQSVAPENLVPTPQNDLKRFENLNKKFEDALDFLLKKQKEQEGTGRRSSGGGSGGGGGTPRPMPPDLQFSPDKMTAISQAAQTVGMKPEELAGIIQAESGGDPQRTNPVSGRVGLIQMGPNEAKEFGVDWEDYKKMSFNEQLNLVTKYFIKRGFKPGMTAEQAYRTVHAGNPSGTVVDKSGVETGAYFRSNVEPTIRALKGKFTSNPPPAASALPNTYPSVLSDPNMSVNYTIVPMQTSSSQDTIMPGVENNDVPAVSTFYSGNFLTLYSKLMYQIV